MMIIMMLLCLSQGCITNPLMLPIIRLRGVPPKPHFDFADQINLLICFVVQRKWLRVSCLANFQRFFEPQFLHFEVHLATKLHNHVIDWSSKIFLNPIVWHWT